MIRSLGIDVGGTFTDLFVIQNGQEQHVKSPTTKEDPSIGVMNAIQKAGVVLKNVENIIHGSTIATNAIIERKYDETAFITTQGFRDVLEIGRYHRKELYNPYQIKEPPLVPRKLRYEVLERIDANGNILHELDVNEARKVIKQIQSVGVKNIAIGFINSYVNDANERRMAELIREIDPEILVATSARVLPKIRLLGRFNLAIINVALQSLISRYIGKLEKSLRAEGFQGNLWMIQSNGGMIKVDQAVEHSEMFLLSGPAAGVAATCFITKNMGIANAVTLDMGGTSADIALVEDNRPVTTTTREIVFDVPVPIPMIDVEAIGAGGGSIAWVDNQGILKVGPRSAGANPGPAFYGCGKGYFTISDANLLLGYIHPDAFMGGEMTVDATASYEAAKLIGTRMGNHDIIRVAKGVVTVANNNMANTLSETLVKKGRDPRDFTLIAFGGAGALHAASIAKLLSIPKVIVPIRSSVFCAFGGTLLDAKHDFFETLYTEIPDLNPAKAEAAFARMEAHGREILRKEGFEKATVEKLAELRYVGQSYEIEIPISGGLDKDTLEKDFEDTHERLYGVKIENNPIAIVSLHLRVVGIIEENVMPKTKALGNDFIKGQRMIHLVDWEDTVQAAIIDGPLLSKSDTFIGPAIVEYPTTTILVEPNTNAYVDAFGSLVLELK
jgi:N-methylhydantoinase A